MNTKILGTGLTGLVGSRIVELLGEKYSFENVSRSTGVDVTNREQVLSAVTSSDAPYVVHLTAKTDVDGCEKDKELGIDGEAWKINVLGTQYIAEACLQSNKKLLYISTDFVFDGEKGEYGEEDITNPKNWYGVTKYEGEKVVQDSGASFAIIRLAYPFGSPYGKKKDFVQAIISRLAHTEPVLGVTNHVFTPTYLDDFVMALDALIQNNSRGIYHVVGSESLTPFDAAVKIARTFGYDESLVQQTTRETFFEDRAIRPYNLSLKNDRIQKLGIKMRTFSEGLDALRRIV